MHLLHVLFVFAVILLFSDLNKCVYNTGTVAEHIERIYRRAGSKKLWFVYRYHIPSGLRFFFPNMLILYEPI